MLFFLRKRSKSSTHAKVEDVGVEYLFGRRYGTSAPKLIAILAIDFEFVETIILAFFTFKQVFIFNSNKDLLPIFLMFLFFILVEPDLARNHY